MCMCVCVCVCVCVCLTAVSRSDDSKVVYPDADEEAVRYGT